MSLGVRAYLDPRRWEALGRHDEASWAEQVRAESPTERFTAPEQWALTTRSRSPEEDREDVARHVRVAAMLARVRAR
ncbi:MAG: hypothetical protein ACOZNI_00945 [Myxococcota bacterium]